MSGFEFSEAVSGRYERPGAAPRPMTLALHARVEHLLQHLRDHKAALTGTIDAEALATRAPLSGEMVIDPLVARVIAYRFTFTGDDGRGYRFEGRKEVEVGAPVASLTTLRGALFEDGGGAPGPGGGEAGGGAPFATVELHFALRTLPEFLASFRPVV